MKLKKACLAVLLLAGLTGCFQTKDELTINADGSGKVHIETLFASEVSSMGAMAGGMGGGAVYPPTSEAEARKFFPGKDFQVKVKQERKDKGDSVVIVDVEFKDINALLASPYGAAHQLTLETNQEGLLVKAVSGVEGIARMAEVKPGKEMGMADMPGFADAQKRKGEMRMEFRITMPNAVMSGNGAREGKSAVWIADRSKCKDAAEFVQQAGAVAEARCDGAGLKFSPVTPTRLALRPFADLAAGPGAPAEKGPDTAKISAAAKFVPYGVVVTRAVDLSGQNNMNENSAELVGAVLLPRELQPQKWGEAALEEVFDAKGNSLKLPNDEEGNRFHYRRNFSSSDGDDGEGDAEAETTPEPILRRVVTFSFRPPDWKVKEIGKIKGSVALHYFGGAQVVKLTNAIPGNWIMDPTASARGGGYDGSMKNISSPKLSEMGMQLSLQMGMMQSGMTMLMLQASGKKAALIDVQVFDAQGKPWPTLRQQMNMGGEDGGCQLIVPGSPPPPLSLAVTASGSGSAVEVPVLVEHIPLTQ